MVAVSGNTGSAPLIGSEVIRDRESNGSIWSEKGTSDPRSDAKSDVIYIWSETDRTPDGV